VVIACRDEDPRVPGKGLEHLQAAGLSVEMDEELCAEARRLNESFFHYARTGRPLVTLKTAVTLDGKIAAPDDNTGWITSDVARAHVQQVRHDHDAILTGIGTALADDCQLTDRSGQPRRRPLLRVVADSLLRLPLESQLVQTFNKDLVVVTTSVAPSRRRAALEARGIPVEVFDCRSGRVDLSAVLDWLGRQEMTSLLIEAGAKLNWAALDSGLVDKTLIYFAPKILGGVDSLPLAGGIGRRSRSGAIRLRNLRTFPVGPDEFAVEAYLIKEQDSGADTKAMESAADARG
jgi:diaminohydroxyphosphoribosylaminopyrimidine deaminase/5-amino-6-(5-phosphoribosylamino)uracil reductase